MTDRRSGDRDAVGDRDDGDVGDATVVRVPVASGGPEGTNSAYVLPERGLVVDPGPPGDEAWAALRGGLRDAGVALEAVDHVVATHWHADHVGLTARLADASGATVHMHERDAPLLADYAAARERRLERDDRTMRSWGVPPERARSVVEGDAPSPLPATLDVEGHADGDRVAGAAVLHTPGHTEGHLALATDGHLFAGDALLPMYTPNVGGSDTRARNPLASFLETLDRLDAREERFHPGHGAGLEAGRLEEIRDHHRARGRRVLDAVSDLGNPTPWETATALFGEMEGVHIKFGAGEAAAHLAHLAAAGDVERVADDPLRFRSRRGPDEGPTAFE